MLFCRSFCREKALQSQNMKKIPSTVACIHYRTQRKSLLLSRVYIIFAQGVSKMFLIKISKYSLAFPRLSAHAKNQKIILSTL